MMSPKAPGALDRYVGTRVRQRRLEIGMSQEKLGEALGITFQQVQKYEKGTNRVSVSRLHQIAETLGVPLSYFYEGGAISSVGGKVDDELTSATSQFLALPEAPAIIRALAKMAEGERRQVAEYVEQLAGSHGGAKRSARARGAR
jgi:transcriptional regulator with XRE-family HTH domain